MFRAFSTAFIWASLTPTGIDKTSSAELSEAINSMFAWYRDSAKCYIYLNDVTTESYTEFDLPWLFEETKHRPEDALWSSGMVMNSVLDGVSNPSVVQERARPSVLEIYPVLAKSRWFTRGWTLQELLAPMRFEFYSKDWTFLGSLFNLVDSISEIAKIQATALLKQDMIENFSIACRMSWASRRKTTRIEDEAYCLLGIFGINMPLLYGEGDKAFMRLQKEIVESSSDLSILAFQRPLSIAFDNSSCTAFASSVQSFEHCQWISTCVGSLHYGRGTHQITHRGIEMHARLLDIPADPRSVYLVLDCIDVRQPGKLLALEVSPEPSLDKDRYFVGGCLRFFPFHEVHKVSGNTSTFFGRARGKVYSKNIILNDLPEFPSGRQDWLRLRCISNDPSVTAVRVLETYPQSPQVSRDIVRFHGDSAHAFRIQIHQVREGGKTSSSNMAVGTLSFDHAFFAEEECGEIKWDLASLCESLDLGAVPTKDIYQSKSFRHNNFWAQYFTLSVYQYSIRMQVVDRASHDAYAQLILSLDKPHGLMRTLASAPTILMSSKKSNQDCYGDDSFPHAEEREHSEEFGVPDRTNVLSDQLSLYGSRWQRFRMLLGMSWEQSSTARLAHSTKALLRRDKSAR